MSYAGQKEVIHSPPNTSRFDSVGVAVISGNPQEIKEFYTQTGRFPDEHPLVGYLAKGTDKGDAISLAYISMENGGQLVVGTHLFHVQHIRTTRNPNSADIQMARRTLETFSGLLYESLPIDGSGKKDTKQVSVLSPIEEFINMHFADV